MELTITYWLHKIWEAFFSTEVFSIFLYLTVVVVLQPLNLLLSTQTKTCVLLVTSWNNKETRRK